VVALRVAVSPLPITADHGEGPSWDPGTGELSWVDLYRGEILAWDGTTTREVARLDRPVGFATRTREGDWVVAAGDGICVLDPSGAEQALPMPHPPVPGVRMNDGAVDPVGRFLAGSMHDPALPGAGRLYGVGTHRVVRELVSGVGISNGLGWDAAGTSCWYVDSLDRTVRRYEYDPGTGDLGESVVVVRFGPDDGVPDGLCVDAAGNIWVAVYRGGRLDCYAGDGRLLASVELPVSRPTSCAFGGPDLDELFVTTSVHGFSESALRSEPLAGNIFRVLGAGTGVPVPGCALPAPTIEERTA
jgi:sugar lactone lactonase YvrE